MKFGDVIKLVKKKKKLACKFENWNEKNGLVKELVVLNALIGKNCFPKVIFYGSENGYNFMIMDLFGPSLESFKNPKNPPNIFCYFKNFVNVLETLHDAGYIHRDVKPENCCCGIEKTDDTVYMIDFGLSKIWEKSHPRQRIHGHTVGTLRYASVNAMKGYELSPKDDLESAWYGMIYLLRGSLPWMGLGSENEILKCKEGIMGSAVSIAMLCSDLPSQMVIWILYVNSLRFEEKPDYKFLVSTLQAAEESFVPNKKIETFESARLGKSYHLNQDLLSEIPVIWSSYGISKSRALPILHSRQPFRPDADAPYSPRSSQLLSSPAKGGGGCGAGAGASADADACRCSSPQSFRQQTHHRTHSSSNIPDRKSVV